MNKSALFFVVVGLLHDIRMIFFFSTLTISVFWGVVHYPVYH